MGYFKRVFVKSLVYWVVPIVWTTLLLPNIGPRVMSFGEKISVEPIVSFTIADVTYEITVAIILSIALTQYVYALILFLLTEHGFQKYVWKIIWKPVAYTGLSLFWSTILLPIIGPILLSISEVIPAGTLFLGIDLKPVVHRLAVALLQIIPILILIGIIERSRNGRYKWNVTWKSFFYWLGISFWAAIILSTFGPTVMTAGQVISVQTMFEGIEYTVTEENVLEVLTQIAPILFLFFFTEIGHPKEPEEEEEEKEEEEPTEPETPQVTVEEPQEVEEEKEPVESETETPETSTDKDKTKAPYEI